ncbi:MAG TPA: hypothetical protein PLP85_00845 [Alcaligenes sp.]|nr:hypothetical protein [Alcaligenes faecalis]HRL20286.1 hypothetical protein [Alcaligenes sp.]
MPIIVLLLFLAIVGGLVYGGMQLYALVAALWGSVVAIVAVLIAVAAMAAPFVLWWRQYIALHGRKRNGQRIVSLELQDTCIQLDAIRKQGRIRAGQGERHFIFADIAGACEQGKSIVLALQHPEQEWVLPIQQSSQRRRWLKILHLAAKQDL